MNAYAIRIDKSAGELTLLEGGRVVMRVPACTGRNPGPKLSEGDLRTPEGNYRICFKNPDSDYHLSLAIDYPGARDAEAAFTRGQIARATLDRILAAHASGEIPPWDTPLGGEIFIHGQGADRDWTLGCVKVSNADIEKLFERVPLGTPVVIRGTGG